MGLFDSIKTTFSNQFKLPELELEDLAPPPPPPPPPPLPKLELFSKDLFEDDFNLMLDPVPGLFGPPQPPSSFDAPVGMDELRLEPPSPGFAVATQTAAVDRISSDADSLRSEVARMADAKYFGVTEAGYDDAAALADKIAITADMIRQNPGKAGTEALIADAQRMRDELDAYVSERRDAGIDVMTSDPAEEAQFRDWWQAQTDVLDGNRDAIETTDGLLEVIDQVQKGSLTEAQTERQIRYADELTLLGTDEDFKGYVSDYQAVRDELLEASKAMPDTAAGRAAQLQQLENLNRQLVDAKGKIDEKVVEYAFGREGQLETTLKVVKGIKLGADVGVDLLATVTGQYGVKAAYKALTEGISGYGESGSVNQAVWDGVSAGALDLMKSKLDCALKGAGENPLIAKGVTSLLKGVLTTHADNLGKMMRGEITPETFAASIKKGGKTMVKDLVKALVESGIPNETAAKVVKSIAGETVGYLMKKDR